MVWGLKLPSGFGDYFPDADFVGYDERLKKYFEEDMSLKEKTKYGEFQDVGYAGHVADCFKYEAGTAHGDNYPFRSIAEHEWPEKNKLNNTYKTLGSLFMMNGELLAVDEDFKNAVELLEPGVHEFRPIEVITRRGEIYPKKYFTMLIGQYLDTFDPKQSVQGSWEKPSEDYEQYFVLGDSKKYMSGLAFSKKSISGAHLWRERKLTSPEIFFSNALKAEFDLAKLRLPKHFQMKEV